MNFSELLIQSLILGVVIEDSAYRHVKSVFLVQQFMSYYPSFPLSPVVQVEKKIIDRQ